MLELSDVEFKRGNFTVGPVSFSLHQGEVMSICGKNGSGKTSTLVAINNYIKLEKGKINVDGKDIKHMKINQIATKIAYVQQEIPEPMGLTVRDIMEIAGYTRENRKEDIEKALDLCEMGSSIDRDFATLSGGEKRMVAIASGIYQNSDYILMDEPTSFLDIDKIHLLENIIKSLKEMGKGILLVLHDINIATRISDTAILMAQGKMVSSGPADSSITVDALEKTYNTRFGKYDSPEGVRFYPIEYDK